jgi:beta-lactamase class D
MPSERTHGREDNVPTAHALCQPSGLLVSAALALTLTGACTHRPESTPESSGATTPGGGRSTSSTCFLLHELGVGELRRSPSDGCSTRVTPASTFKIAHALAALDSRILAGPSVKFGYDGSPNVPETWKRDHTLATALRYSVVWYFQRVATMLGPDREMAYLAKFGYGNQDASSGLTSFWLDGSLRISPDEEETFLVRLYEDALPVSKEAMRTVQEILVQPAGVVVNATGEHPFDSPWPEGAVVSAKTGSSDDVRWLVGHVQRQKRSWVFVSCMTGPSLDPLAAIDLAATSLRAAEVL